MEFDLCGFSIILFGGDVFDKVSTGEEKDGFLVLEFLLEVILDVSDSGPEFDDFLIELRELDGVFFSQLVSVIGLFIEVFSESLDGRLMVKYLTGEGLYFVFIGFY